jgi:hypothetical protein
MHKKDDERCDECKRYINSFAPDAGRNRILSGSSPSFSSGFVTSCRFRLAAARSHHKQTMPVLLEKPCGARGLRIISSPQAMQKNYVDLY